MQTHPELNLISHFQDLPDPRVERTREHRLIDLLVIAVCTLLCGGDERGIARELIDLFGHESVRQPDPRVRRTALAAPLIAASELAQLRQREDLAELLVHRREFAQFLRQGRKELTLQAPKDRRKV